jgi:hypothetical protein
MNWIVSELFYPDEVSIAQILTDLNSLQQLVQDSIFKTLQISRRFRIRVPILNSNYNKRSRFTETKIVLGIKN